MANVYISPTGSGNRSGSSIENAAAISSINTMIQKAGAGGQVLLLADKGDYKVSGTLNITASGKDGLPVTVKGISSTGADMDAHFVGTRPAVYSASNPAGNELFKLMGSGNITFQNMTIDNVGTAFRVGKDMANVTIENVDANNVARFFEDYASGTNKTATIDGLILRDINVEGFSRGVVRLQYDTHNVVIENVHGDSQRQDGDNFAIGVHLDGTVHDVLISKTVMENATDTVGGRYWNGDAFATERGVYDVTFQDTVARGSTDGGYDLKSMSTVLIRTVAEDNARNYRIWGETTMIDAVSLNPNLRGGSSTQVQVWVYDTGKLTMEGGLIADSGSKTRVFENHGILNVSDVEIIYASNGTLVAGKAVTGYIAADLTKIAATGAHSAADFAALVEQVLSGIVKPVETAPVVIAPTPAPEVVVTPPAAPEPAAPAPVIPEPVVTAPVVPEPAVPEPVVTEPVVTAPVVTAPVVTAPVVETPTAPAPLPAPVTEDKAPALPEPLVQSILKSTSASETLKGTSANDIFSFGGAGKQGNDVIQNFGHDDLLVTKTALADGNKDGIITFGSDGKLTLSASAGTVKIADLKNGLRFLGSNEDGFFYGDVAARPKGAQEGKLFANNTLTGDAGDKAKTLFFVDTALHQDLGNDILRNFGAKDAIITTTALDDLAIGAHINAVDGRFGLHDGLGTEGSLAVYNLKGETLSALEYDGSRTIGDMTYFVYSAVGSATDLGTII